MPNQFIQGLLYFPLRGGMLFVAPLPAQQLINWGHRFGELGILIGDKKFRGKGYGTEACRALIEYAFDRLNLKTVVLAVFGCHDAGITMYRRLGFRIQGRLKGLYTIAGRSVDKVYMIVTRKTFIRS